MYKNIVTTFLAAASGPAEEKSLPRPPQKLLQPEISKYEIQYEEIVEDVKKMLGFSNLDIEGNPRNGLGDTLDFLWTNEDLLKSFRTSSLSSLSSIEDIQMGLLNPDQAADFITILESFRERLHARIDAARVALSPFLRDRVFRDDDLRIFRVYFPDAGPITDAVMSHLANIPNLMLLDLSRTQITDAVMSHLAKLTNLQVLCLSNTQITDESLSHLTKLGNLHFIDLQFTHIGDAGMAHLAKLPNLQKLFLSFTDIGDAGMARLAKLPNLQVLSLAGHTGITDKGLLDSVNPPNFPKLSYLSVPGRLKISPETIDELRRRFPGITFRGSFL